MSRIAGHKQRISRTHVWVIGSLGCHNARPVGLWEGGLSLTWPVKVDKICTQHACLASCCTVPSSQLVPLHRFCAKQMLAVLRARLSSPPSTRQPGGGALR